MLKSLYITKSRIRQGLLTMFFTNPSRRYYLREIQRLLGYSAGNIRRELLKFQEDNLFTTERVGNLLYYKVNSKHPCFKEIKSIVAKTIGVEGHLRTVLSAISGIKSAFIYGSFAAGKEKGSSDIDLMIIGEPNVSALHEKISSSEQKLQREINPTIYSYKEYQSKKQQKRGFITELLSSPKIILIGSEDGL